MDIKATFGARLKELRGEMKQDDFGALIGVSRASISYYENGTRTADVEILGKICEKYHVSADWLLGLTDAKTPHMEIQAVIKNTGLSELALKSLCTLDSYPLKEGEYAVRGIKEMRPSFALSKIIENPLFKRMMFALSHAITDTFKGEKYDIPDIEPSNDIKINAVSVQEYQELLSRDPIQKSKYLLGQKGYTVINVKQSAQFNLHSAENLFSRIAEDIVAQGGNELYVTMQKREKEETHNNAQPNETDE